MWLLGERNSQGKKPREGCSKRARERGAVREEERNQDQETDKIGNKEAQWEMEKVCGGGWLPGDVLGVRKIAVATFWVQLGEKVLSCSLTYMPTVSVWATYTGKRDCLPYYEGLSWENYNFIKSLASWTIRNVIWISMIIPCQIKVMSGWHKHESHQPWCQFLIFVPKVPFCIFLCDSTSRKKPL